LQRIGNDAAFSMSYIISGRDRGCITYLSGVKPLAADVSFPPAPDDLGAREQTSGGYDKSRMMDGRSVRAML
jgi:hypothetical protein